MNVDQIVPWLSLKHVPRIGNLLFKRLIDHFETPETVFCASMDDLSQVEGISLQLAHNILNHKTPSFIRKEIEETYARGFHMITMGDSVYPPLLIEIPDPPPVLYVYGRLDPDLNHIAVVGSRNATPYGISTTQKLCGDLVQQQLTVVSGMARGIDTAAHEGTLQAKGRTIAVLGSGLVNIYPPQNRRLFHRIADTGAVISEFPLNAAPEAHHFPMRNRIISGMTLGTVVVEAAVKSGSLITARLAAEQNREVFAVPGSVKSIMSRGSHNLLKQGAKLVETAQDIVEELPPLLAPQQSPQPYRRDAPPHSQTLDSDELNVYQTLHAYPMHIDELARAVTIPVSKLTGLLLNLELKGVVKQLPGTIFTTDEEQI